MKIMKIRITSIILALLMVMTYTPLMVSAYYEADDNDYQEDYADDVCSGEVTENDGAADASFTEENTGRNEDWHLNTDRININYDEDYAYLYVVGASISKVESTDLERHIIAVNKPLESDIDGYDYRISIFRCGAGEALITVTAEDGSTRTCQVTVEATPLKINCESIIFDKKHHNDSYGVFNDYDGYDRDIVSAESSDDSVVSVKINEWPGYAEVIPEGTGSATVTVTDRSGEISKVEVTVSDTWRKANLKGHTMSYGWYGEKELVVNSKPYAAVTVKIAGRKYTKKCSRGGSATFKLRKLYKLNTKYIVICKYKGAVIKYKDKLRSCTEAEPVHDSTLYLKPTQKYIRVKILNAHKGDTLYISFSGRRYKYKFSKEFSGRKNISTEKAIGKYTKVNFKIKNKYGQIVCNYTEKYYWQ